MKIGEQEKQWIDSLHCNTLFIKFLDVHRDAQSGLPLPTATLVVQDTQHLSTPAIVPCVFITNATFSALDTTEIDDFAQKTTALLLRMGNFFPKHPLRQPHSEVQFDCDWTSSTREAYFYYLQKIATYLPAGCTLSATIRLHQLKYPEKTGVPPVGRGMLMLYNTNEIERMETPNSILHIETAEKYLEKAAPYPLPLDVAVPVFSWTVVFRDSEFYKILPRRRARHFADTNLFRPLSENQWEVASGTFAEGIYLRQGDRLRAEGITPAMLRRIVGRAHSIARRSGGRVAFFHLDTYELSEFQRRDFTFER